jgi:glycosyltransferase involved in cell wall biosynthesis
VIGIDASRALTAEKTGTETYTSELLQALAALNPPDDFELYLNAPAAPTDLPKLGTPICMPFPRLWTHLRLSARMATHRPGVLFVPAHVVPAIHPHTVVTIHDLGYLHVPDAHPDSTRRMLDFTTRWSARAARAIIAISEATKRDLIEAYGAPASKITVIHHGVSPRFHARSPDEIAETLDRLNVRRPYVLTIGTYQPRKNLGRLAAAMSAVEAAGLPHRLVIAGKRGWLADEVDADIAASGQVHRIQHLGYVASDDLPALYAGASAFCLPSLHEGFGMPILEAMASAVPVVTSNSSALAEIAGDAAITIDPTDFAAIGAALVRVLSDSSTAQNLRRSGPERATEFTWRRTAEATLALLRRVRDAD